MVGARNASANARRLAPALAEPVAAKDYAMVSGMARGIDTAAHQGALSGGTVAVLGGGAPSVSSGWTVETLEMAGNCDMNNRLAITASVGRMVV